MPAVSLPLHGYHDQPVPNHFLRQKRDGQRLPIVLPGYGYTCDMPVLYYTVSHLIDQGADIMQVEYTYNQQPDYAVLADDKRRQWLLADVLAAARAGLAQRDYQRVTVIGKSLGTRAMPALLGSDERLGRADTIWFTPLLKEPSVHDTLLQAAQPALAVIGTADPHYDPALLTTITSAPGRDVLVVAGAEHGLEIAGDVVRAVQALEQIVRAVRPFAS